MSETDSSCTQKSEISEDRNEIIPNGTLAQERRRRPYLHLLSRNNTETYFNTCVPLHEAALNGDVKEAIHLLRLVDDPQSMLSTSITKGHQTVLHIATGAKQTGFVQEMINLMGTEAADNLTLQDENGNTAFCFAAAAGSIQIAKIMLKQTRSLLTIRNEKGMLPLYMAALFGQREMAKFLYDQDETTGELNDRDRKEIFFASIHTGLYDLARELLKIDPELAVTQHHKTKETAMHVLARKPTAFVHSPGLLKRIINLLTGIIFNHNIVMSTPALELVKCIWKEITKRTDVDAAKLFTTPSNLLSDAAKLGNYNFLAELIRSYPDLLHELDQNKRSIFHVAILHRRIRTFDLIHNRGFDKALLTSFVDVDQNNILHLAAKYPPPIPVKIVSGAALEMQQELLLFKEVEKMVQPPYREMKNSDGKTPQELFTEKHTELLKKAEKWMKSTSTSCMLVATLIATVVFSSAFSVPGGNDDKKGIPIHLSKTMFQIFAVADAVALSSSSISIVTFLFILISRCAEKDFLTFLPCQLMVGLLALFISVVGMMIAFTSSFFLAYQERLNWVPWLTIGLASLAPILFCLLQWPLLRDVFKSTYRSRVLPDPK